MKLIEVGYIARAHGIRGDLRAVPHQPESTVLAEADAVYIDGRAHEVVGARSVKGGFLLRLAGIGDRNRAEALRGKTVSVDRELIALDDDEVFLVDLIGCRAVLADGTAYGEIADVMPLGAQDLLVIHSPIHGPGEAREKAVERLLPFVPEFVQSVDLEAGEVVVDPPEELPETAL